MPNMQETEGKTPERRLPPGGPFRPYRSEAAKFAERYKRICLLSETEQMRLAEGRVLIVGLGGLGGHVLDMLARMGVGRIVGADGDVFEPSNLNRQLLCTEKRLGMNKAEAARLHVAEVNSEIAFTAVPRFVRGPELEALAQEANVIVDALGGLRDRAALQSAATRAGAPLVSAGISGLTGWVAVVLPREEGPAAYLGAGDEGGGGVEEKEGNLAPTAALAAALQAAEVLKLLTGKPHQKGLLLFDLAENVFAPLEWN